jgi:hypothetical protein
LNARGLQPSEASLGHSGMFSRRELVYGGAGLGAALIGVGHRAGPLWAKRRPFGAPALWLADRAFDELALCDGDALVLRRVPVVAPVALAADGQGGVWAASALEGLPRGPHQLVHVDRDGAVIERLPLDTRALRQGALTCDGRGRPVVVQRSGGLARAAAFGAYGAWAIELGFEPACVAARGAWLWCAGVQGEVVALGLALPVPRAPRAERGEPRDRLPTAVQPLALAVDADGRGAWVLGRTRGGAAVGRWHLADSGATRRVWLRTFDLEPGAVTATSRGEVWLADARLPRVIALKTDGRVRVWRRDLPGEGVEDALATPDGGAWLAACGALLRVGPDGASQPGQGGFGHLVALASAAPRDPC